MATPKISLVYMGDGWLGGGVG